MNDQLADRLTELIDYSRRQGNADPDLRQSWYDAMAWIARHQANDELAARPRRKRMKQVRVMRGGFPARGGVGEAPLDMVKAAIREADDAEQTD